MNINEKVFYKSKLTKKISSVTLDELKNQLIDVSLKREEIKELLLEQEKQLKKTKTKRKLFGWFPLSKILQNKVDLWENEIAELIEKISETNAQLNSCKVKVEIDITQNLEASYGVLYDAYSELQNSERIWDVTTSTVADRVSLRTTAHHLIERRPIKFTKEQLEAIDCDFSALHLENANGADLYIYPIFILIRDKGEIALIDLKEVDVDFALTRFIETESVPNDSEVIDHTWAKANKDGTRDRRFSDNYQIPIAQYGEFHIKTNQGLNEVYMVSNASALVEFSNAFNDFHRLLSKDI